MFSMGQWSVSRNNVGALVYGPGSLLSWYLHIRLAPTIDYKRVPLVRELKLRDVSTTLDGKLQGKL